MKKVALPSEKVALPLEKKVSLPSEKVALPLEKVARCNEKCALIKVHLAPHRGHIHAKQSPLVLPEYPWGPSYLGPPEL